MADFTAILAKGPIDTSTFVPVAGAVFDPIDPPKIGTDPIGPADRFDATLWERKSLDLPGGGWQNRDGTMIVPPGLAADNSLGTGINFKNALNAVMAARQALGYGGEFHFRNDVQWVLNAKDVWADMLLAQCIRVYDKFKLTGDETQFLMRAAVGVGRPRAIGTTFRPGPEQSPATLDSAGNLTTGTFDFYTTDAVGIDTAFGNGTYSVHVANLTTVSGHALAAGDRVFLSLGEPAVDVREPDFSMYNKIANVTPDGSGSGGTLLFEEPIGYALNPATDCWMFRNHAAGKPGIYRKATGAEDPTTIADNRNARAVFYIAPLYDVKYAEVEGIHIIGETPVVWPSRASGSGINFRWARGGKIHACAVKNWGPAFIIEYCDGGIELENVKMLGETAKDAGELVNATGRTTRVHLKTGDWNGGTNRIFECQHGAQIFADGVKAKNWNTNRDHKAKSLFNTDQAGLISVADFDLEGAGTQLGTPGGTGLTVTSRVRFYRSLEMRLTDKAKPQVLTDMAMLDPNCQVRISDYNAAGDATSYRTNALAASETYVDNHNLGPADSGTKQVIFPLPYGLISDRSKLFISSLVGIVDIAFDPGAATGFTPQSVMAQNVNDAVVTTDDSTGISVFSTATLPTPWSPKSSPGTPIILPQPTGPAFVSSVGMVNGLNCPDVVAVSGNATVTSPGNYFTAGMVGMTVTTSASGQRYFGATGGGKTYTTIASVAAGGGSAVLTAAPNTSFTGLFVQARGSIVDAVLTNGSATITSDSGAAVFPSSMAPSGGNPGSRVALLDPRALPYLSGPVTIIAVAGDHKSATLSSAPTGIPGSGYTGLFIEDLTGTLPGASVQLADTYLGTKVFNGAGGDDPATIGSGIASGVDNLLPDWITNLGTNGKYNQGVLDPACTPQLLVTTDTTCDPATLLTLKLKIREFTSEPGLPVPLPTTGTPMRATDPVSYIRGGGEGIAAVAGLGLYTPAAGYWLGIDNATSFTGTALPSGTVTFIRKVIKKRIHLAALGINVTAAIGAGGTYTCVLSVYGSNAARTQPNLAAGPIAQCGSTTLVSGGRTPAVTGTPWLDPGTYWVALGYIATVAPASNASVKAINAGITEPSTTPVDNNKGFTITGATSTTPTSGTLALTSAPFAVDMQEV